jgi:3-hydroxyisobutyrate dehydrogenase-like beta-hydroxyacid dehydrogenase
MVTRNGLVVAVLGLGEAGSVLAGDLVAAGAMVRGYDPAVAAAEGITDTGSEAEAARGADLVLSVNSAKAAVDAFRAGRAGLRPGALWADLNTASPGVKRELAGLAAAGGTAFADVAMMAPVPGRGLRVPMLASGEGAARFAGLLAPLGAGIEVLDGPAGLAATRKLLRSVFYKGMAAAIVEALDAARAAGHEQWLREHIAAELAAAGDRTVQRITAGTRRHAVRRAAEMEAAAGMLTELGIAPFIAEASRALHERLAGSPAAGSPAAGSPAAGSPAAGPPAAGPPAAGPPAAGSPAAEPRTATQAAAAPPPGARGNQASRGAGGS